MIGVAEGAVVNGKKLRTVAVACGLLVVAVGSSGLSARAQCPDISSAAVLNGNAAGDAGTDGQPRVITDGQGTWLAVWTSNENLGGTVGEDDDIFIARSLDNGTSWIGPSVLNGNAETDAVFAWDRSPQVATDGTGTWVAVWQSIDDLGGTVGADEDVLFARSVNNGASWSAPSTLNSNAAGDSGSDGSAQVVTDGAGTWIAVWVTNDTIGGTLGTDQDILFARSTDGGVSWSPLAALNTNADADAGNDKMPRLATDGAGNWLAVWVSGDTLGGTIGSDDDILFSRSTDDGLTWSAPAFLNSNADIDAGADVAPSLATDENNRWVVVWHSNEPVFAQYGTDNDILFARSINNGASWSNQVALNTNADDDAGEDTVPFIATDAFGMWITLWSSTEDLNGTTGVDRDIFYALSTDNGLNWTGPALFNSTGQTDGAQVGQDPDLQPQLASDGLVHWVAVWPSGFDLAGVGSDLDLFTSRFQLSADDCNGNGTFDPCEFAGGTGDCNDNFVLDVCETASDCDGNGRPDECDLTVPGADCNNNGQLDTCESGPDCNGNGRLDECDLAEGSSPDCNGNLVPDECDIESCPSGDASCQDCTGNGIPDGCEPDCDANGTADSCDIAACPSTDPSCQDCDGNGVLDGCDLTNGTWTDGNGNGIPDICEVCTVSTPLAIDSEQRCLGGSSNGNACNSDPECPGGACAPPRRNRFISFEIPAGASGNDWAIRIKFLKLYDETICPTRPPTLPDLSSFGGAVRWVTAPESLPETEDPDPNRFIGAATACCPEFRDWPAAMTAAGGGDRLYVFGAGILACSRYAVQFVDTCCPDLTVEACYSQALEVHTGKFGDMVRPFFVPGGFGPDVRDVTAVVDKFRGLLPPRKVDVLLRGEVPPVDAQISVIDVTLAVDAFRGFEYRGDGPSACGGCP